MIRPHGTSVLALAPTCHDPTNFSNKESENQGRGYTQNFGKKSEKKRNEWGATGDRQTTDLSLSLFLSLSLSQSLSLTHSLTHSPFSFSPVSFLTSYLTFSLSHSLSLYSLTRSADVNMSHPFSGSRDGMCVAGQQETGAGLSHNT